MPHFALISCPHFALILRSFFTPKLLPQKGAFLWIVGEEAKEAGYIYIYRLGSEEFKGLKTYKIKGSNIRYKTPRPLPKVMPLKKAKCYLK